MAAKGKASRSGPEVLIRLSREDLKTLVRVSRYYERSMGIFRYAITLTATSEIRSKYRHLREESSWLLRFAEAELQRAEAANSSETTVNFTPLAIVAFWGRLLSSLESSRSRRKLTREEATRRRDLAERFEREAARLFRVNKQLMADTVGTRRQREAGWMWAHLNPAAHTDKTT